MIENCSGHIILAPEDASASIRIRVFSFAASRIVTLDHFSITDDIIPAGALGFGPADIYSSTIRISQVVLRITKIEVYLTTQFGE